MTHKEIVKFVKDKLVEQNKRCSVMGIEREQCLYRSESLKCAIGHLIPDDLYSSKFEGHPVKYYFDYESPICLDFRKALETTIGKPINRKDLELLKKLQQIHDFDLPENWGKKLSALEELV